MFKDRVSSLKESLIYRLRDYYWESPTAQAAYSAARRMRARNASSPHTAMVAYCDAARRTRDLTRRHKILIELFDFVKTKVGGNVCLASNPFLQEFFTSADAIERRSWLATLSREDRLDIRKNVIVLKSPEGNEPGVLLVKYTDHFKSFLLNYDLERLSHNFSIVLEPSWYPYPEPHWVYFSSHRPLVVCQTISDQAAQDMWQCGAAITPIAIGAQDWVDHSIFYPIADTNKDFDLVMNASFMRLKRHDLLFRTLRKLHPRKIKVALIGHGWERTREEFDDQIRRSGLADQITLFQGLSGPEINLVLNRSRLNVLLSKVEGGNVAMMEAMAAGTPTILYRHIVGPRVSDITPETGLLADEEELPDAILEGLATHERFHAREWFLQKSGYLNSTRCLNDLLREQGARRGVPWTKDVVPKTNRKGMRYVDPVHRSSLEAGWQALGRCLGALEPQGKSSA